MGGGAWHISTFLGRFESRELDLVSEKMPTLSAIDKDDDTATTPTTPQGALEDTPPRRCPERPPKLTLPPTPVIPKKRGRPPKKML